MGAQMNIRVVAANLNQARFYDIARVTDALRKVSELEDPSARLHDRDLKSDRPGIVYARAPAAGKRRGGVLHSGTGGERHPRQHAAVVFASRIAAELERAYQMQQFSRLVLVAGPSFLGRLRAALSPALKETVVAEVRKDLLKDSDTAVREHLPAEIFWS